MSIWPGAIASNNNLYVAVDFPNSVTALNGAINSSVTSINVTNASNYPSSGGFILIDSELIYFASTSGNTLTGCLRGQDGTSATPHLNNSVVNLVTMAEHHNVLKDEIIAIETSLVLTSNTAVATNGSGLVTSSTTTATELGYVHGVTSAIQTQLNSKQASLGYTPVNKAGDSMSGNLTMLSQHAVLFQDTGTNTITLEAPNTIASNYLLKLPTTQGGVSTFLSNDGSGNLSWATSPGTPPAGATGDIQYSDGAGHFQANDNLNWDGNNLNIQGSSIGDTSIDLFIGGGGDIAIDSSGVSLTDNDGASITLANSDHSITLSTSTVNANIVLDPSNGIVNITRAVTITPTTNQLVLGTTNTVTISSTAPSASRTYTIPDAGGSANFVLSVPYVSLIGQTSSIGTTTLFTPTATGTYRVSIYIVDTAGTTFTLQGTIGWTDAVHAQTATTSTLTNTTDGYLQSSFFIEATSGNAVTYAVTLTGTATYNVYVVAERLS